LQRQIFTRDGSGCRAGLIVRDAAGALSLLTCGHPFQRDEPFATQPIGETLDAAGRLVRYVRLRYASPANTVDAALIALDGDGPPAKAKLPIDPPSPTLLLNQHKLELREPNAAVWLGPVGFTGLALATGPPLARGESGSLALSAQGHPAALAIGMVDQYIALCPLPAILHWFALHGICVQPAALAIQENRT
jgi:hypothetical protein